MSEELLFASIDEVHSMYETGEVSPVEVLTATLERLERLEPRLNAFITLLPDQALEQAKRAERLFAEGAPTARLTGIPVSVKDIFSTAGIRTSVGSRIFADDVPDSDAAIYTALKEAGAVIFGKNNMLEFAYGFVHPDYGQANNPWDTNRTAGGSSSGSASCVAAGIGYASIGTDTGGSIRIPASFCGIVGLKPTYGLVDSAGCFPLSHSLDHVGPLTRSVGDSAAILEALTRSSYSADPAISGLRVGVISNLMGDPIDGEVETLVYGALDRIRSLGVELNEVEIPSIEDIDSTAMPILLSEASYHHREWFPDRADDYSAGVRANLTAGLEVTAVDYLNALTEKERFTRAVSDVLDDFDILLCPTVGFTATERDPDFEGGARDYILRTLPFDVTGHPALTVPIGNTNSRNLPAGLELVAGMREEEKLYRLAAAYEREVGGFASPTI